MTSKGLQEADLCLSTLMWQLTHTWRQHPLMPHSTAPALLQAKGSGTGRAGNSSAISPSPSHFMHTEEEEESSKVGWGCQLLEDLPL